jgi:hypothetical protein
MEWAELGTRRWPSKLVHLAKLTTYVGLFLVVGCANSPKAGPTIINHISGPYAPPSNDRQIVAYQAMLEGPLKLRLTSISAEAFRQLATKLEVNFYECARTTTEEYTIRETPEEHRSNRSYVSRRQFILMRSCIFQSTQSSIINGQSIEEYQQQNIDAFVAAYSAYLKCDNVGCISNIAANLQRFRHGRAPDSPLIYVIDDSLPYLGGRRDFPDRNWWLPGNGPCSRHNQRIRFYNPMDVNPLEEFVCALMLGVFENGR